MHNCYAQMSTECNIVSKLASIRCWSTGSTRIQTLILVLRTSECTIDDTIMKPFNYLTNDIVKFIYTLKIENALVIWWLSDAVKFRSQNSVTNANCISIDTSTIVKATNFQTNPSSWIIGTAVSNKHDINAVGRRIETTALTQKNIACTPGSSCSMSPPTTIWYVLDLGSSVEPFLTCIAIAVKAKFQLVVVIESHYCNFDRSAYKLNKLANAVFHFCKVTGSNTSRCVKEEQDVLSSTRIAGSSLSTKSMVMLVPFKRQGIFS